MFDLFVLREINQRRVQGQFAPRPTARRTAEAVPAPESPRGRVSAVAVRLRTALATGDR
jgi:hypothetical protein